MNESKCWQELEVQRKALDMVLAIDHVRDVAAQPAGIFSGVTAVMGEQFGAGICALYLVDQETGTLRLKVIQERDARWQAYHAYVAQDVAQRVLDDQEVSVWSVEAAAPAATLHLAEVPVFMEERPLGVLLLGRLDAPFDAADVQLLHIAESQMDSAIIQAHVAHELAQRNKELETIYRVDHIRDQNLPFDRMLDVVLEELCAVIQAEIGFVMLYNHEGQQLELRAITDQDFLYAPAHHALLHRLAAEAVETCALVSRVMEAEQCAVMCVPLILRDEIIGVFGAVNRGAQRKFTSAERRLLLAIVSQMDTAILESLERRQLRSVLGRSIDQRVLERLLENPNVDLLEGERTVLSVLYADLRGSTALATRLDPELLVDFINAYLSQMTELVISHEGTLDKFVGDEVMALFGAPLPQPDHALRAVRVGLAMVAAHRGVVEKWRARGIETAGLGVGIATGEVVVGEIGCQRRTDYTIIGHAANLGARICSAAQAGEVLISAETYELIKEAVIAEPRPGMVFKGLEQPVTVYAVSRVVS